MRRAAARSVVRGLTVATGDVMMSRTRTFPGFRPVDVTFQRMSRSVTKPTGRPCFTTTKPPIFFAAIRFAASRTVRSGSMTMTSRVITSRTKTMPQPPPTGAASAFGDMKASNPPECYAVAGMAIGIVSASRSSHGRRWPSPFRRIRCLQAGYLEQPRKAQPFRARRRVIRPSPQASHGP